LTVGHRAYGPEEDGSLKAELARFCEALAARNYSPFTTEHRAAVIGAFVAWAKARGVEEPRDVSRQVLEQYRLHLFHHRKPNGEPLAPRTQLVRLVAVRAFFRWLTRENRIVRNPAADLELPRGERCLPSTVLSPTDVETILNLPNVSTAVGLRDRAILETFYATGMRRLELTRLRLSDFDLPRRRIVIKKGKGAKDRIVPAGERAARWIETYCGRVRPRLAAHKSADRLFLTMRGGPLNPKKLSTRVGAYILAAGLDKRGSCHLFRHTMATLMLENGADIRFIQAMLGHERLDTTQIYTHVSIAQLAAVHAASHPAAIAV
jgi:integrase/recombinase XerD